MTVGAGGRSWLLAGRVGRPHGLDGSFYVSEPTPALLEAGAAVLLEGRELRIERRAGTDLRPIVRLELIADRAAAQSVHGAELRVPRVAAPQLESDEWWAEDLEGCTVLADGRKVGTVTRLTALPSCEVLEVERSDGGGELLVPLVVDAVVSVDIELRQIEIDLEFLGAA